MQDNLKDGSYVGEHMNRWVKLYQLGQLSLGETCIENTANCKILTCLVGQYDILMQKSNQRSGEGGTCL